MITGILAGLSGAAQLGSSIAGFFGGRAQADATNKAAVATAQAMREYYDAIYWGQVDYQRQLIDKQYADARRQDEYVAEAADSIREDFASQVSQLIIRGSQEVISAGQRSEDTRREGQALRSTVTVDATARGVGGNTADIIAADATRQRLEAQGRIQQNLGATLQQLGVERHALTGRANEALNNIPIRTFDPIAPVNPAPVATVSGTVQSPSPIGLVGGVVSGFSTGVRNYSSWSGQTVPDILRSL